MLMSSNLIMVYGSLKQGFHNHFLLDHDQAEFITTVESCDSIFNMVSVGLYPAATPDGNNRLVGELYRVNDFTELDKLEEHPAVYCREQRLVVDSQGKQHQAWIYIYQKETMAPYYSLSDSGVVEWIKKGLYGEVLHHQTEKQQALSLS
ncbi:gamma-glutamylcyclotransferase [Vibrio sp. SS-MA-C1-2]|uniref:gamma-glutamylcyclotransferase family protein n=1 Tax=Vibrio sp. SS-MA-C1-2 TaxID=2908646 RepID=UPI001F30B7A3|nr:gamma-glutamylcyclotransferase family protein [Vibrio sp. SS-MA-C1-2]UJF18223.1 gamma-glutamylcyclotransferase [Vibrio sp. SS-MA-C1-2]